MTKEERLKKRYRAEKRFKCTANFSSLAIIFVLILVQNIFKR